MKPHNTPANRPSHVTRACQLLCAITVLFGTTASPIFAQDFASAPASPRSISLAVTQVTLDLQPKSADILDDEFQAALAPLDEVSSNNMVGQAAEAPLPCEAHVRANSNDTIPSVSAATHTPAVVPEAINSDQPDHFLVEKIQAVQRVIRLMQLKEEIILEKARFEQKLVDLQKKIENR